MKKDISKKSTTKKTSAKKISSKKTSAKSTQKTAKKAVLKPIKQIINSAELTIDHINLVSDIFAHGIDIRNIDLNLDQDNEKLKELLQNIDLTSLKSLQRLGRLVDAKNHHLSDDKKQTIINLHNSGLHSAYHIASIPQHQFVQKYSACFVGNNLAAQKKQATNFHQVALACKSQAIQHFMAISQHTNPFYAASNFNNLSASTAGTFGNLPNYENLFGQLDFCECPDCRSIFSPAAYLVDLMRIEQGYISGTNPSLLQRRSDLNNVPLSCSGTNDMIPKLQIVNNLLMTAANVTSNGVYNPSALTALSYPFNLPFNTPLTQSAQYLQQNQLSIAGIWQEFITTPNTVQQNNIYLQQLGISPEQWAIISTPTADTPTVLGYYGLQSTAIGTLQQVPNFLLQTGLTYDEFNELLTEDLSAAEATIITAGAAGNYIQNFFINSYDYSAGRPAPLSVDPNNNLMIGFDGTTPHPCNIQTFDEIHRFIRLTRILNWSFTDLDWALYTISQITSAKISIANNILQPLAWIKNLKDNQNLSVNQICGFLNLIKNFGKANGPTFWEEIFVSPFTQGSPFMDADGNDVLTLDWIVPLANSNGSDPAAAASNQLIQNNLAIALNLNNINLGNIGRALLAIYNARNTSPTNQTLTLDNPTLSLLYRVSLLPKITGMTLTELTILYQLSTNSASGLLTDLLNATADNIFTIVDNLITQVQWLQNNNLSVYRLQYWLSSPAFSNDPAIQNQIIDINAANNFFTNLNDAMAPLIFDENKFLEMCGSLINDVEVGDLFDRIWGLLPSYIEPGKQIVTSTPAVADMVQAITAFNLVSTNPSQLTAQIAAIANIINSTFADYEKSGEIMDADVFLQTCGSTIEAIQLESIPDMIWGTLANYIVNGIVVGTPPSTATLISAITALNITPSNLSPIEWMNQIAAIANLISATLLYYQPLQQKTFAHQLSVLYNIDQNTIVILAQLADLYVQNIASAAGILADLQLIQIYVDILNALKISYLEIALINDNPTIPNGSSFLLNFDDIETLYKFAELKQTFDDKYDLLLNYLIDNQDLGKLAEISQITNWDFNQLTDLANYLQEVLGEMKELITINDLYTLYSYFSLAQQLNCHITTIIQILSLIPETQAAIAPFDFGELTSIAEQLWNGLVLQNQNNPAPLTAITNSQLNQQRDILLPLAIHVLNNPNINIAQDLSEYFLTDVEVDAIVETSIVVEAISAVQTYIYRCRNYLETGAIIQDELNDLWPWMETYRVWQANREVFLYPENYIEPDLRKNKTDLFVKLQSDIQQGDISNPDVIEAAIKNYLDGLVQISNLEIVSSATYDDVANNCKNLFILGVNNGNPNKYYYLTAVFVADINGNYGIGQWSEWMPVNCDMQPESTVTSTFAFGKWLICWVEKLQNPCLTVNGAQVNSYDYNLQYSNLNNSGNWSGKQTITSVTINDNDTYKGNITTVAYPVYFNSIQTLFVPYQGLLVTTNPDKSTTTTLVTRIYTLGQQDVSLLLEVDRYIGNIIPVVPLPLVPELKDTVENLNLTYYQQLTSATSQVAISAYGATISAWVCLDVLPATGNVVNIFSCAASNNPNFSITANPSGEILCNIGTTVYDTKELVNPREWHHIAFSYPFYPVKNNYNLLSQASLVSNVISSSDSTSLYLSWLNAGTILCGKFTYSTISNEYIPPTQPFTVGTVTTAPNFISNINSGIYLIAAYDSGNSIVLVKTNLSIAPWMQVLDGDLIIQIPSPSISIETNGAVTSLRLLANGDSSGNSMNLAWTDQSNSVWVASIEINPLSKVVQTQTISCNSSPYQAFVDIIYFNSQTYYLMQTGTGLALVTYNFSTAVVTQVAIINYTADTAGVSLAITNNQKFLSIILPGQDGQYQINWAINKWGYSNLDKNGNFIDNSIAMMFTSSLVIKPGSSFSMYGLPDTDKNEIAIIFVNDSQSLEFSSPSPDAKIYFDGAPVLSIENINPTDQQNALTITFGQTTGFIGFMQEALIYSDYLSDQEIATQYNNGLNFITHNFNNYVAAANSFLNPLVNAIAIMSQPDWNIAAADNISVLNIPTNTNVQSLRLNSNAVATLEFTLALQGIDAFLDIPSQLTNETDFDLLLPEYFVIEPSPTIDFYNSPMSNYYWELFFYIPFYVARQLQNQKLFQDGKQWFEYIFDPAISQSNWQLNKSEGEVDSDKYWRFVGLRSLYNPTLALEIGEPWSAEFQQDIDPKTPSGSAQLYDYHNDPFDPHAIARLRPIAYQKTVIMHYVANIIAWGDNLYRQYNEETISEALMLYMIAADLLGDKPQDLGICDMPSDILLQEIISKYPQPDTPDSTPYNSTIPEFIISITDSIPTPQYCATDTPNNYIQNAYFGLPQNLQLNTYWDQISQRLYNIRHALTIDGIFEQIPLFAPAIDPMQLVQQVASGQGAEGFLNVMQPTAPYYRFKVVIAKAKEMANVTIQFGQSLLATLEKKDAEQLSRMYNLNQQNILSLTATVKQNELNAATQNLQTLNAALQNAQDRYDYFSNLISDGLSETEEAMIVIDGQAIAAQAAAQVVKGISAGIYMGVPTIFGLADGGNNPGEAVSQGAGIFEGSAQGLNMLSSSLGSISSYERRNQDWQLQQIIASDDIAQVKSQILTAQYQETIAQQEIAILEKTVAQQQAVYQFLFSKFSSEDLYEWLIGQLAALYFQSYQLTYKLAQQAAQAWQFEKALPTPATSIIQPNYWNNLYHGLTCGEAIMLDLQRLEQAYMDQDKRYLEIRKTIALSLLDPIALNNLKTSGSCIFNFSELNFDYDFPGHYCRQIKNIAISFPALIGPYQNIHATLTQTGNKILLTPDIAGATYLANPGNKAAPATVRVDMMTNQQIAISSGMNDTGLIELNFGDERYLPFEGTGAISSWQLDMPIPNNSIDFNSLSDVIVELNYTAQFGGNDFKSNVASTITKQFNGYLTYSMAQDFLSAWYGFIQNTTTDIGFAINPNDLRKNLNGYATINIAIIVVPTSGTQAISGVNVLLSAGSQTLTFAINNGYATAQTISLSLTTIQNLTLTPASGININNTKDIKVIINYAANF